MDFSRGIAVGVAAAAVLVQLLLAVEYGDMAGMYREFQAGSLPLATRITISPGWLFGAPVACAALVSWVAVKRPARVAYYVAVALVAVLTAAATWYFPRLPLWELAGNIR